MPVLENHHDLAHPVEGDEAWSESYYFNCYDPDTDAGFFTRIGVRPNEGTIDSHFALWLPSGDVAHLRQVDEITTMVDRDLQAGPVRYVMDEPMQRWQLRAEGTALLQRLDGSGEVGELTIAADVTFDALTPAIGVDGQGTERRSTSSAATAANVGKGHLEQAGRWSGWVEADGVRHTLGDARGNRDKSWGPRRWGGPTMWRWFSVNVGGHAPGEGTHLGGIRIGSAEAEDLHRGWVWRDGTHASVRQWDVRTEVADDGWTQRVVHLAVSDKADRTTHLRGDLLRVAPLPRKAGGQVTVVNEGLTRWSLLDGPSSPDGPEPEVLGVGYGIAEYLNQLGADNLPVVPVE
ncbi:MAG: hypothetical protein JJU45_04545 [Acidimicrobiia bacterium]|nr:hypothetical protein [Acidimicrobiia bacterium]